jgi:hypothetical protein
MSTEICLYCGIQYTCNLQSDINCIYFIPYQDGDLEEYNKIKEKNKSTKEIIKELNRDLLGI